MRREILAYPEEIGRMREELKWKYVWKKKNIAKDADNRENLSTQGLMLGHIPRYCE
jgi:hypothetical protein